MLSQTLLENCEEFLEQIANENHCEDLNAEMESLRFFLEKEVDGFTSTSSQELAYAIQCRLEEIWNLISPDEKKINPGLEEHFGELMTQIEQISEYQGDRSEFALEDETEEIDDEDGDFDECDEGG